MNFDKKHYAIAQMLFAILLATNHIITGKFNVTLLFSNSITISLLAYVSFKTNKKDYLLWKSTGIFKQLRGALSLAFGIIPFAIVFYAISYMINKNYLNLVICPNIIKYFLNWSSSLLMYMISLIVISSFILILIKLLDDLAEKPNKH